MRLAEIEKKARSLGVRDTWRYSKKDLIRYIQRNEGNPVCFATPTNGVCNQMACCWRSDCLK
jgi:hypothetical protein